MNKYRVQLDIAYNTLLFLPSQYTYTGVPLYRVLTYRPLVVKSKETLVRTTPKITILPRTLLLLVALNHYQGVRQRYLPIILPEDPLEPGSQAATVVTSKATKKTPQLTPEDAKLLDITEIGAAVYNRWARKLVKKEGATCFSITIQQINDCLEKEYQEQDLLVSEMLEVSREELELKLPAEYHDYIDVFNRTKAKELPPYRPYNHKIELEGDGRPP